jgi:carbon storage regulator CsrA
MLVLGRKKNESVVLGDEVTLTVEEICGGDGRRIFGCTVRLGFQSPRCVSIYRSELLAKRSGAAHTGRRAKPAEPRPGRLVEIPDAEVRLRVEVPPKVPVCCNGTPMVGIDSEDGLDGTAHRSRVVYHFVCHREDRITICNNIIILTLDVHRFVPTGNLRGVLCP